jgi:hypothetical protein
MNAFNKKNASVHLSWMFLLLLETPKHNIEYLRLISTFLR